MLSTKVTTKAWGNESVPSTQLKPDGLNRVAAGKEGEAFGGNEDIGAMLNKVADPNWVDPKKMRKGVGNDQLDKDAFLKLFLAQLKNQDPTNTLDSHELAAQLAQFSTLEKLGSIDDGVGNLAKKTGSQGQYEVLSLVGKKIMGDSTKVLRNDEKETHDVTFTLGADADVAELSIKNINGQEIRKMEARGLKAGPNKISWDGILENGQPAQQGEYNIVINAKNKVGQKIAVESRFEGIVSGVAFTGQGPVLKVGQQNIRMSDVKAITDPGMERMVNSSGVNTPQSVKNLKAANGEAPRIAGMASNMDSIGMQNGLAEKLGQEAEKTMRQMQQPTATGEQEKK